MTNSDGGSRHGPDEQNLHRNKRSLTLDLKNPRGNPIVSHMAEGGIHERHRPEETPLYRIVETCYPKFLARLEAEGASRPHFVQQEFDHYLKCGLLEHGFLRVKCDACHHEHLVAFSCKRRGFCPSCGLFAARRHRL